MVIDGTLSWKPKLGLRGAHAGFTDRTATGAQIGPLGGD